MQVDWLVYGMRVITAQDSVNVKPSYKNTLKFGSNASIGTSQATIMTLPGTETGETYVAANSIDTISSADNGDTQTITVEGHTISGSDLTFVSQTKVLTGQTKAVLDTPLARVERAFVSTGTTDLAGAVYIYEDGAITSGVPDVDTTVHAIIEAGENQTLKAAMSTASTEYGLITRVYANINEKTAASGILKLRVRTVGKVFRTFLESGFHSNNGLQIQYQPYLQINPNSDVILTAEADGAGTDISGGFDMIKITTE